MLHLLCKMGPGKKNVKETVQNNEQQQRVCVCWIGAEKEKQTKPSVFLPQLKLI